MRAVGGDGRAPQSAKSLCLGVFFLIAFSFAPASSKKKRMEHISFLYLRAWILACRGRRLRRPAKKHKDAFSFIVLLYDQKYQKSYKRAFPSLIYLFPRARVSRASHAWQVRAARDKAKVGGFALSAISTIPRVRTYHTKKPSRFVHALSARPLDMGGAGVGKVSALTE